MSFTKRDYDDLSRETQLLLSGIVALAVQLPDPDLRCFAGALAYIAREYYGVKSSKTIHGHRNQAQKTTGYAVSRKVRARPRYGVA